MASGKILVIEFVCYIEGRISSGLTEGLDEIAENKRELVAKFIGDTKELIKHNEWGIGFENLLDNLYEIDIKIGKEGIDIAKEAMKACEMNYKKWECIEELE